MALGVAHVQPKNATVTRGKRGSRTPCGSSCGEQITYFVLGGFIPFPAIIIISVRTKNSFTGR